VETVPAYLGLQLSGVWRQKSVVGKEAPLWLCHEDKEGREDGVRENIPARRKRRWRWRRTLNSRETDGNGGGRDTASAGAGLLGRGTSRRGGRTVWSAQRRTYS